MSQLAQTRPRSVTEIIDASFRFYRARFGDLLVVSALLLVPPAIVAAIAPLWLQAVARFVSNFMYLFSQGAIAVIVAAALERNQALSAGEAFRELNGRWGKVLGASIMSGLMVFIGFVLLIIPGFIAAAWTAVAVPVAAIEGLASSKAIDRSRALAKGRLGHVLGTVILTWFLVWLVVFGVAVSLGIAVGMLGIPQRISGMLFELVMVPIFPLVAITVTLLYYDLRVRGEAADVSALIDALPATPAQPT
ncbi:MAG: hypothetical protein JF589_09175 [Gemmatimonadetes bacterium]|nr:hypothetical protein [Gemmatimonadota bacterium]